MLEVKGKRGKMLVCEDRECNTRKTVSQITNSRCPICHKKLELRGEGEAKTFICSCGHREKLSAYNKRKQEDKNKASKNPSFSFNFKHILATLRTFIFS